VCSISPLALYINYQYSIIKFLHPQHHCPPQPPTSHTFLHVASPEATSGRVSVTNEPGCHASDVMRSSVPPFRLPMQFRWSPHSTPHTPQTVNQWSPLYHMAVSNGSRGRSSPY
jgi:hypothetical protein